MSRGTEFAESHNWNTVEKGIMGGAEIISKKWVNHKSGSQTTLYSMGWNPINPLNSQYATEIDWANNIAKNMYAHSKNNFNYNSQYLIPKYSM